ncbi:MAG: hypothetical protein GY801_49630, partial [bacterium]|nr:hypothetical protein [bacterium]
IPYSNFNLAIRIARGGTGWGIKSFFLIGLMFLFSYYVYFIPSTQFHVQLLTGIGVILVNLIYQGRLAFSFSREGFIIIDYVFFTFYILVGIALSISIVSYIFYKRGFERRVHLLARVGRILYLILAGIVSIVVIYTYVATSQ